MACQSDSGKCAPPQTVIGAFPWLKEYAPVDEMVPYSCDTPEVIERSLLEDGIPCLFWVFRCPAQQQRQQDQIADQTADH